MQYCYLVVNDIDAQISEPELFIRDKWADFTGTILGEAKMSVGRFKYLAEYWHFVYVNMHKTRFFAQDFCGEICRSFVTNE